MEQSPIDIHFSPNLEKNEKKINDPNRSDLHTHYSWTLTECGDASLPRAVRAFLFCSLLERGSVAAHNWRLT